MRIVFEASKSGLNNNGGTKTIIRSAETLSKMGHDVVIWANVNYYTWHTPKVDIKVRGTITNKTNPYDVVIAVAAVDVDLALTIPAKSHWWWIRAWSLWTMPEPRLLEMAKKIKCIANTSWICEHLNRHGIDCELCFAGLDLDIWSMAALRPCYFEDMPYNVGFLNHHRHKTKNSAMAFEIIKKSHKKICELPSSGNLGYKGLCDFYNGLNVFIACSVLEGFHQVPAEAALCGCLVAGIRHPRSGTGDYLNEDTGILFDSVEDAVEKLQNPDFSKVTVMQEHLRTHIGSREKNMKKFVEVISG